jgi:hypothetical protein
MKYFRDAREDVIFQVLCFLVDNSWNMKYRHGSTPAERYYLFGKSTKEAHKAHCFIEGVIA